MGTSEVFRLNVANGVLVRKTWHSAWDLRRRFVSVAFGALFVQHGCVAHARLAERVGVRWAYEQETDICRLRAALAPAG